jgi:ABC-type Fe3+-siderophore transport system permease subunit
MTDILQFIGECSLIIAGIVFVGLVLPWLWRKAIGEK